MSFLENLTTQTAIIKGKNGQIQRTIIRLKLKMCLSTKIVRLAIQAWHLHLPQEVEVAFQWQISLLTTLLLVNNCMVISHQIKILQ